jgi:uncharacterized membrane protein YkvA (DUF1232 family)
MASTHTSKRHPPRGPYPRSVKAHEQEQVTTTRERPSAERPAAAARRATASTDELLEIAAEPDAPARSPTRWGRIVDKVGQRIGPSFLRKLVPQEEMVRTHLRSIPDRMQKLANQSALMLELVDDFRAGTYRAVAWRSLAIAAGALLYSISPADVIPDYVPGAGALDDAIVLGLAIRLVKRDLTRYCEYKGYDPADYF